MAEIDGPGPPDEEFPRSTHSWSHVLGRAFAPCSVRPSRTAVGSLRRVVLHDLELVELTTGPTVVTREKRAISSSDRDCFALLLPRRGRELVTTSDGSAHIQPGEGALWRFGVPASFACQGRLSKICVTAPAGIVAELCPTLRTSHLLRAEHPALRVLSGYIEVLLGSAAGLDPGAQEAARNAALELLRSALETEGPAARHGAALHSVVTRWIAGNVASEELSPGRAAQVHGVSVRTLHRVFAEHGETFATTVRNIRLERAHSDIVLGRANVTDIAHRWGFSDSSHLTRRFRQRYGLTPREARLAARTCPPATARSRA